MKRYVFLTFSFIVMLNVIVAIWLFVFYEPVHEDFNCVSNHRMIHGDVMIRASYFFQFKKNNGSVKINGVVFKDDRPLSDIGRIINFSYRSSGRDQYFLTSYTIQKLPLTNETESVLTEHFPLFFVKTGTKLSLVISPEHEDYIIVMGGVPAFYCDKI